MKRIDKLRALIASLSRGEKRRFRLYIRKYNSRADYLALFDKVAGTRATNDANLARQAGGQERLSAQAQYLYGLILKSLRDSAAESDPKSQLLALFQEARILLAKHLYPQAADILRKANDLCRKYEFVGQEHELLALQSKLPDADLEAIHRAWAKSLLVQRNEYDCSMFKLRLTTWTDSGGGLRSREDRHALEQFVSNGPLRGPEEAMSRSALLNYHSARSSYHYLLGDDRRECCELQKAVDVLFANDDYLNDNIDRAIGKLRTLCFARLRAGDIDGASRCIDALRRLNPPPRLSVYRGQSLLFCELVWCNTTLQADRLRSLIAGYPELLREWGSSGLEQGIDFDFFFQLEFAVGLFQDGDIEASLQWMNKLLVHPALRRYQRTANFVRVLNLLVHFELGSMELLPYELRSTYRYLAKQKHVTAFERCLLRHLKMLAGMNGLQSLEQWYRTLYEALRVLAADPQEGDFLRRFDYLAWLRAKIENTSFANILGQKLERRRLDVQTIPAKKRKAGVGSFAS